MKANPLRSSAGFTYLMALMVVLIMGIMLAAAAQSWKMIRDRELEEELLFRGGQYKDAITAWYKPRPGQRPPPPLNDLKDLLKDPNSLTIKGGTTGGIIGVATSSELKPIKQANFPTGLEDLEGKSKYSEWQFVYQPKTTTVQQGTTAPGTGTSRTGAAATGANSGGSAATTPFSAR